MCCPAVDRICVIGRYKQAAFKSAILLLTRK